jgi:hypothetical protein
MRKLLYVGAIAGAVAAVVLTDALRSRAEGPQPDQPRFRIVAQSNSGNVWQVDAVTGQLRLCLPPKGEHAPPQCGPAVGWASGP